MLAGADWAKLLRRYGETFFETFANDVWGRGGKAIAGTQVGLFCRRWVVEAGEGLRFGALGGESGPFWAAPVLAHRKNAGQRTGLRVEMTRPTGECIKPGQGGAREFEMQKTWTNLIDEGICGSHYVGSFSPDSF